MWSPVAVVSVGIVVGVTGAAAVYVRPKAHIDICVIDDIESIRSTNQAIRLLQRMCQRAPTEDVAARLTDVIKLHGISERAVQRLSRLHRLHGADLGSKGYAITLVWSSALQAIAENAVIVVDD